MGKLVLMAVLVLALVFWLRLKTKAKPAPPDPAAGTSGAEIMVACARCGVHLPASEAVLGRSARPYCGGDHRAAAQDGLA